MVCMYDLFRLIECMLNEQLFENEKKATIIIVDETKGRENHSGHKNSSISETVKTKLTVSLTYNSKNMQCLKTWEKVSEKHVLWKVTHEFF